MDYDELMDLIEETEEDAWQALDEVVNAWGQADDDARQHVETIWPELAEALSDLLTQEAISEARRHEDDGGAYDDIADRVTIVWQTEGADPRQEEVRAVLPDLATALIEATACSGLVDVYHHELQEL